MVAVLIVGTEQVYTEIVFDMSPNGVDMVSVILRVVIFHEEEGTVQPVVMRLSTIRRSCPSEVNIVYTRIAQFLPLNFRQLFREPIDISVDELR